MILPARVTQAWIETVAPTILESDERAFFDALADRNWKPEDIRTRVLPHMQQRVRARFQPPGALGSVARPVAFRQALHLTAMQAGKATRLWTEADLEEALHFFYAQRVWRDGRNGHASRQQRFVTDSWPGVGPVDLELVTVVPALSRCWIEVKWDDVGACVWDTAKMAVAVAEGACDVAYLVAGASANSWATCPGREMLDDGRWDTATDLLEAHLPRWRKWMDVQTRPLCLPATIHTERTDAIGMRGLHRGWELRAVEITASPERWIGVTADRRPILPTSDRSTARLAAS